MVILAEKTKTPQKNNSLLKTKRILNILMSAKGDPVFTFSFPVGGGSPLRPPSVTPMDRKKR